MGNDEYNSIDLVFITLSPNSYRIRHTNAIIIKIVLFHCLDLKMERIF